MIRATIALFIVGCSLGVMQVSGAPNGALPVYGTTRYGHPAWAYRAPPPYYRQPYAYPQNYPEDLYYQMDPIIHYPYYPVAGPAYSKNQAYRNMYPYYFNDRMRPYSYYANEEAFEPTDDIQGDSHDDSLRTVDRAESLPVGQETWFEGETAPRWQNDYDDVNAAFLQNLIMSQMYNDALAKNEDATAEGEDAHHDTHDPEYDEHRASEYYGDRSTRDFEDEDVRELKALTGKPLYHVPKTSVYTASAGANDAANYNRQQQWRRDLTTPKTTRREEDHYSDDYQNDEPFINWGSKRNDKVSRVERKQKIADFSSTTSAPSVTATTRSPGIVRAVNGQKEVVLLRPATPVRHPFPEPVLQMLAANSAQTKRTPSVYDTIKQLLSMEESFKPSTDTKARMQKRFVASDEDLVGELKGLKRRIPA